MATQVGYIHQPTSLTRAVQSINTVTPTVVIGLGGTGGNVLIRLRRRFVERYGALSKIPVVSYLWLDTDDSDQHIDRSYIQKQIDFDPSERVSLCMPDTTVVTDHLDQFPHIHRWFYDDLTGYGNMTKGAGQFRPYSRLGFFNQFGRIQQALRLAVQAVRDLNVAKNLPPGMQLTPMTQKLNVSIIASVAGGTGSGIFLDMAYLLQTMFPGDGVTVNGYLLMPGLYALGMQRAWANGYAALKELNHFSFGNTFQVNWTGQKEEAPSSSRPFSMCYLIDAENEAGRQVSGVNNISQIYNMVADNLFLDFAQGDFADYKRGIQKNLEQYLNEPWGVRFHRPDGQTVIDQKFRTAFSSFGLASLKVPQDRIRQACAALLCADVIAQWGRLDTAQDNAASINTYLRDTLLPAIQFVEGTYTDRGLPSTRHDVLQFLSDDGSHKSQTILQLIRKWACNTAAQAMRTSANRANFLHAARADYLGLFKAEETSPDPQQWGDYPRAIRFNREALGKRTLDLLNGYIATIINQQNQDVGYAIAVLEQLANVFKDSEPAYQTRFEADRSAFQKQVDKASADLETAIREVGEASARSNWDGRRDILIEFACRTFEQAAITYFDALIQVRIRNEGIELLKSLREAIAGPGGMTDQLRRLREQLNGLRVNLMHRVEQFSASPETAISHYLYTSDDLAGYFYPQFVGSGETRTRNVIDIGKQMLSHLQSNVMDLPSLIVQSGTSSLEQDLIDFAEKSSLFARLPQECDVYANLKRLYPNPAERRNLFQILCSNSRYWLRGGASGFKIEGNSGLVQNVIGRPMSDPELARELDSVIQTILPNASIKTTAEVDEILFYSELGGVPVNYPASLTRLRDEYAAIENGHLHTDKNDSRLEDLMLLDNNGRQKLEQASEAFVMSIIHGELTPVEEPLKHGRRIVYRYRTKVGIHDRELSLGTEAAAIQQLQLQDSKRAEFLNRSRARTNALQAEEGALEALYALLSWMISEGPCQPEIIPLADGVRMPQESTLTRVIQAQLQQIEQIASQRGSIDEFRTRASQLWAANPDAVSRLLPDGNRKLALASAAG